MGGGVEGRHRSRISPTARGGSGRGAMVDARHLAGDYAHGKGSLVLPATARHPPKSGTAHHERPSGAEPGATGATPATACDECPGSTRVGGGTAEAQDLSIPHDPQEKRHTSSGRKLGPRFLPGRHLR